MKCSVIIPTLNRAQVLKDCVFKSLLMLNLELDEFEVLVVDNGSTDQTGQFTNDFIKQNPLFPLKYIKEPEPGMLSGRHKGALEAKGEILVFIDDDVILDPNWLGAIADSFNDPQVHLVGGRCLPRYEVTPPDWLEWFWFEHEYGTYCSALSLLDFGEEKRILDANFIWGLNFSIRKSTLFELGGFNPDCIPKNLQHYQGNGETGLTMRANEKNYKALYQPKAMLYHVIPEGRLTYDYFDSRYFYQGVCDSYSEIRAHGGIPESTNQQAKNDSWFAPLKQMVHTITGGTFKNFSAGPGATPREIIELRSRFEKRYKRGYEFHRTQVAQDNELLAWVLKDDYWEYNLPANKYTLEHD